MGQIWKAIAKKMLDPTEYERANRMQEQYGYQRQPGLVATFFANRRANNWADQYWNDSETINRSNGPLTHMSGSELGHPRGCTCLWCDR